MCMPEALRSNMSANLIDAMLVIYFKMKHEKCLVEHEYVLLNKSILNLGYIIYATPKEVIGHLILTNSTCVS